MRRCLCFACFLFLTLTLSAQAPVLFNPVHVSVDLSKTVGGFNPIYRWFGYDESDYTVTQNGRALLQQLHDLSPVPVYIRAHFLLATGDGKPDLKWSSSNVYTEDPNGNPVYNWIILDRIFDAYAQARVVPMVELGFMPKALSSHPDPYHIGWPIKPGQEEGWSFPPKDYKRWEELARQVAAHMVTRYGMQMVSKWYWEVWNEPNGSYYWKGSEQEYNQLYDYAAAGVREAIPHALVGGPATTGPGPRGNASAYLVSFLSHCAKDKSVATGGSIPLDFISFHVKGSPNVVAGHVQMGLDHELKNAAAGFAILHMFPRFASLPVILSEADPEGCAACSARLYPPNAYRNGPLYASYTAAAMNGLIELADRDHVNLIGMLTWAFEFEDKPYFDGYRTLATNGVDKPVLNFFRMAGLMRGDRVAVASDGAVPLNTILARGVRSGPDIDALASSATGEAAVLLWNYHDHDVPAAASNVIVSLQGLPASAHRILLQQYRIDQQHSNAYTVWKRMGSPQHPTPEQYSKLQAAGQLELFDLPRWISAVNGKIQVNLELPRQALSLLRVTWPVN